MCVFNFNNFFSLLSSLFIFPSPSPPLGSSIDAIRACIDVILKSSCHLLSTSTSCTTDTSCSERNKIGNTRDDDDTGNASDDERYTSCRSGPVTMASSQQSTPDHFDTIPLGMKRNNN